MAKKKKVTVKKSQASKATDSKTKVKSVKTASSAATATSVLHRNRELPFNKENFKWVGIGIALIALGMILMLGGYNDNPAIWDESKIYGFQRTLLAPVVILAGLAVEMYAIFK